MVSQILHSFPEIIFILDIQETKNWTPRNANHFWRPVISADGIKMDPEKIRTILTGPVPKEETALRSFLGLCSYYQKFMKGFYVTPLHWLTEAKEKFIWTRNCQEVFNKQEALSPALLLLYPRPGQPFILDTATSNTGSGAVLSRVHDDRKKIITYFSKCYHQAWVQLLHHSERASCHRWGSGALSSLLVWAEIPHLYRSVFWGGSWVLRIQRARQLGGFKGSRNIILPSSKGASVLIRTPMPCLIVSMQSTASHAPVQK